MKDKRVVYGAAAVFALLVALILTFVLKKEGAEQVADESAEQEEADDSRDRLKELKDRRKRGEVPDLTPAVVSGKVTDQDGGKGIGGATVLLSPKSFAGGIDNGPGEPSTPIRATTDAGGTWSISRVPPGPYTVSAAAPEYLPGTARVRIKPGEDTTGISIGLERGGFTLSGTVSDIGGGPVEDVLVNVISQGEGGLNPFSRAAMPTVTDGDGNYQIQLRNGSYVVSTFHPEYVSATKFVSVQDGPRNQDIELTPAAVIEGVVLTRDGRKPVSGARVTYADGRNQGGDFRINLSSDGSAGVATSDSGTFVLRGLSPGAVKLSASSKNLATSEPAVVSVGIGESVGGVELLVDPAYSISGFVVPKGNPEGAVSGVLVGAFSISPMSLMAGSVPTGEDGYFQIDGVQPGNYLIGAIGEETLPNLMGTSAVVTDADVTDVIVEMDGGAQVTGRVDPPQVAKVSISMDAEGFSLSNLTSTISNSMVKSTSDAEGEFDLSPVAPGALKLVATTESGMKGEVEIDVPEGGLRDVVIALQVMASVRGKVLDEAGVPQSGVMVDIRPKKRSGSGMNFGGRGPFGDGVSSGEDGSFFVKGLEAGEHTIIVKSSRGQVLRWAEPENPDNPSAPMVLDLAEAQQVPNFDLVVEARNGVIEGTVLDADGLPAQDVFVRATVEMDDSEFRQAFTGGTVDEDRKSAVTPRDDDAGGDEFEVPSFYSEAPVLTDETGSFVFRELRADYSYTIVAEESRGGARAMEKGVSSGSRVVLNLEQLAGIEGIVRSGGAPVESYKITIDGPADRTKNVRSEDGAYRFERLDPGSYTVRVQADDGVAKVEDVEVQADDTTNVDLDLDAWGTIEGSVVDTESGEGISRLSVLLDPEDGSFDPSQGINMVLGMGPKTNYKGEFELNKVAPGKGQIIFLDRDAMGAGGAVAIADYEIEAGEDLDLGEIKGIPSSDIEPEDRGDLGFSTTIRTAAMRPRPPGTESKDAVKDEDADDTVERLWVSSVKVDGPADEGGLEPADEITEVEGKSVASIGPYAAQAMLSRSQVEAGQTIRLRVKRDGSTKTIRITAADRDGEKVGGDDDAPPDEE